MKSFLVPSDCTDTAISAMSAAILLGQRTRSRLYFVHAMPKPVVPAMTPLDLRKELDERYKQKHKETLESQVRYLYADLNVRAKEVPYECIIANYPVDVTILEYSSKLEADLIVMGTSGVTGINKLLTGTHTMAVIKKSKVPVLVIPSGYSFEGFRKVALTINVNEFEYKKSFDILNRILESYRAELDCFYILPKDDSYVEAQIKLIKIASKLPVSQEEIKLHIQETEPISENLKEWIDAYQCDVIAMLPREWSIWKDLFTRSMTKEMVRSLDLPILVLP